MIKGYYQVASVLLLALLSQSAAAESPINSGNTAWILTSTALVLFMTLPGLALFYGGLVRSKNVLSVLMQCFAITCVVSILWLVGVYSMAFAEGNDWVGGLSNAFMGNLSEDSLSGDIPESVFAMFQLTFAIITPALIVGAFAERIRFASMLLFSALWLVVVYGPVTHWVWGGGLARSDGTAGLCRRDGRACHGRYCGFGVCFVFGTSSRISEGADAPAQHDDGIYRCSDALGGLVWFQRR